MCGVYIMWYVCLETVSREGEDVLIRERDRDKTNGFTHGNYHNNNRAPIQPNQKRIPTNDDDEYRKKIITQNSNLIIINIIMLSL